MGIISCLSSCISFVGRKSEEVSLNIQMASLTFTNLGQLCPGRDIRLPIKVRFYTAAVRSILLSGSETWPLSVDVQRLLVVEHRCL